MAQFTGLKARPETYSTATENNGLEDDPKPRNTEQPTQWTGPLRSSQKLVDEEQGHADTSGHTNVNPNKLARPKNPRKRRKYATSLEPKKLEIAQTRSYPDREPYPECEKDQQEMVILALQNAEATEKSDDDCCEIRWIHLQAKPEVNQMSFDDLKTATADVPGLHNDELALALKMLIKIESTNGKPFAYGKYGKYLVPTVFRDNGNNLHLHPGEKPKYAIFFSLPYFDLKPLRKLDTVEKNASIYPIRTLLQSHYRLASTEERDKKQAVRQLAHLENDKVISLPELWCLMINKHTIITYAPVCIDGADGLFGRTIKTKPASKGPTHVRYNRPDGHRHYFLVAQCKTWAQLCQTIKLHDENFNHELRTKDGLILSESNWSQMISKETSLYIDLSVNSDHSDYSSDYHSDSSTNPDILTDDETESEHEYVEIEPDVEIVEVRPGSHSQTIEDLVRNMHLEALEARIARFRSISPVRRAETIGLSPSAQQFRDFGFEMRSDSPQPLPLRRSVTVDFPSRPDVKTELEDPMGPTSPPDRRRSVSSDTTPTAVAGVSSSPKIAGVKTLYDSEDTDYPDRSWRKDFHSRFSHRIGIPNYGSPREQSGGRDRFLPTRLRRHSPSPPRMSWPSSKAENEEIGPRAEPNAARKIGRGGNRADKRRGGRRGRGDLRRLGRKYESSNYVSNGPSPIFTWPTTHHHASIDGRIQDEVLPEKPAFPADNQGNGTRDRTKRQSLPEKAPSTYPLQAKDSEQDDDALVRILEDAYNELAGSGRSKENKYYKSIEGRTLEEVENEMKRLLDIGPVEPDGAQDSSSINTRKVLEYKTDIVRIAKKLYEAFAPVNHPCSIREKYWGGVYLLLKDSNHHWVTEYPLVDDDGKPIEWESELQFFRARTSEFLNMIEYIINGLSPSNDEQQKLRYRIPRALFKAFTHIVMFYVLHGLARVEGDPLRAKELYVAGNKCTDRCNDLLTEGLHQLLVILHTDDDGAIVSYEPLESETIMALVMENLLDNPLRVKAGETQISELYSEYISELVFICLFQNSPEPTKLLSGKDIEHENVRTNKRMRIDQEIRAQEYASVGVFGEIKLLSQELDIVERTLSKQLEIMLDYSQKVDITTDDNAGDMQAYSTKLRKRVLERSIKSLEQKIDDFRELKGRANYMQFSARQSISVRTESKEKAILIFTVVTVIFLPLSFVTGYLGMNVDDVRNMGQKQGIFWIIAMPITFVNFSVILLLIMGPNLKKRYLKAKME